MPICNKTTTPVVAVIRLEVLSPDTDIDCVMKSYLAGACHTSSYK